MAATPEPAQADLERVVEYVVEELRRRLGSSFVLDELADLYGETTDWATELADRRGAGTDSAAVVDAAFARYAREAVQLRGRCGPREAREALTVRTRIARLGAGVSGREPEGRYATAGPRRCLRGESIRAHAARAGSCRCPGARGRHFEDGARQPRYVGVTSRQRGRAPPLVAAVQRRAPDIRGSRIA